MLVYSAGCGSSKFILLLHLELDLRLPCHGSKRKARQDKHRLTKLLFIFVKITIPAVPSL